MKEASKRVATKGAIPPDIAAPRDCAIEIPVKRVFVSKVSENNVPWIAVIGDETNIPITVAI